MVTVPCGPRDEVEQEPIIFKGHTRVAKLVVQAIPQLLSRGNPCRVPVAVARVYSDVPAIIKKYLLLDPEYRDIYNLLSENNEDELNGMRVLKRS